MKQRHNHPALLLLLLATGLTACTSLSPTRMMDVIREDQTKRADSMATGAPVAGYSVEAIMAIAANEPVYIAYYDSAGAMRIVSGNIVKRPVHDSTLLLQRTDTVTPRALSVAVQSVSGVYRPSDHPEAFEKDGHKIAALVLATIMVIGLIGVLFIGVMSAMTTLGGT